MSHGAFADTKSRYRDLEELVDYREYEAAWTLGVRGELVKNRGSKRWDIRTSGSSVGPRSITTGAFGSAFCELAMPGSARAEFFVYG